MRVLMFCRATAQFAPGGDLVLMDMLAAKLTEQGVIVRCDLKGDADVSRFDVVHLFNSTLPEVDAYARRCRAAGVPYVLHPLAEDWPLFLARCNRYAQQMIDWVKGGQKSNPPQAHDELHETPIAPAHRTVNEAAAVIVTGRAEQETVRKYYSRYDSVVVPLGADRLPIIQHDAPPIIADDAPIVLCVGRLEARKNQLGLLAALRNSPAHVVLIAGTITYQPDYARAVVNFRRAGRTTIIRERLSERELARYYAAARVHCLPSWYELPGLATLEAAWQGCSTVYGSYGTTDDYLPEVGIAVAPDSEQQIRAAIKRQAEEPPVPKKQISTIACCSWDDTAAQIKQLYESIL